jgi:hypothetical protein
VPVPFFNGLLALAPKPAARRHYLRLTTVGPAG